MTQPCCSINKTLGSWISQNFGYDFSEKRYSGGKRCLVLSPFVPPFFIFFLKKDNFCDFLLASLDDTALPGSARLLLKERICSLWSKFFPLREHPNMESKLQLIRVVSHESVSIHFIIASRLK